MKKFLMTLIAVFFSFSVIAQSVVVVTPQNPARCSQQDYPSVNWIYDLEFTENAQLIEVKFKTNQGSCLAGVTNKLPMQMNNFPITFFEEGLTFPWSYRPTHNYTQVNEKDVEVKVTFDKTVIFEKNKERVFTFKFSPSGRKMFLWNFNLSYNKESDTTKVLVK